jgi:5-methylcytosine-specific restriction endonuclease McrA
MGLNRKRDDYKRHSAKVTRGPRWKAVRMHALDRDDWQCVQCGERRRLECDHIQPVKTHPELSYSLGNLQILCGSCHARKTRIEVGGTPLSPKRQEWRDLLSSMKGKHYADI